MCTNRSSRGPEAWPPSAAASGKAWRLLQAGWPDLPEGPSGASTRAGRRGQNARADTPHQCPRRPAGGASPSATPRRAPEPAPSRRRGAAGGGSGRASSPGLRASSSGAQGEPSSTLLPPPPPPPRPPPPSRSRPSPAPRAEVLLGWGPAGRSPGRAAVGATPAPRPAVPPPQPACGRRSRRGVEREDLLRRPEPASGPPRAAGATSPHRASVAAFGSGTLPGPRRLRVSLPRLPPAPSPPAFLPSPDPGRAAIPLPLSGRPSSPPLAPRPLCTSPPGGPLRPSLPLAAWTVRQAADAARSGLPGPQCPERGECLAGRERRWASRCFRREAGGGRSSASLAAARGVHTHPHLPYPPPSFPGSKSPGSHCQPDWEGRTREVLPFQPHRLVSRPPRVCLPPHPASWLLAGAWRRSVWTRALGEWAVCRSLPRASLQVPWPAWF